VLGRYFIPLLSKAGLSKKRQMDYVESENIRLKISLNIDIYLVTVTEMYPKKLGVYT
jgi:hypothetical protein